MCALRLVGGVAHLGRGRVAASASAMPPQAHGDGRHRGRQCCAVCWPVLPESRGFAGEVPAGHGPGHHPAVRAVRLGPVRVAASPLLHRGGRAEWGSLQQWFLALPLREGGRGRLRGALCTQALRVRVVRVLPAVLRGRLPKEEGLKPVPVALRGGRAAEIQPLYHHASGMGGPNAAL